MATELLYRVALPQVPHIGSIQARILVQHFGNATGIFKAQRATLEKIEGIGEVRARSIVSFRNFSKATAELSFVEKYKIQPLFLTDQNYPQRLLNCYDPPTLLFYRGNADLNASKILAVI